MPIIPNEVKYCKIELCAKTIESVETKVGTESSLLTKPIPKRGFSLNLFQHHGHRICLPLPDYPISIILSKTLKSSLYKTRICIPIIKITIVIKIINFFLFCDFTNV